MTYDALWASWQDQLVVEKRDGRLVSFDCEKIILALEKAYLEFSGQDQIPQEILSQVMGAVLKEIGSRFHDKVKIYEVQNIIEHVLLDLGYHEWGQTYLTYRVNRDLQRNKQLDYAWTLSRLENKETSVVNENANKDSKVFNTQRDLTAGSVAKVAGLKLLPKHVANAHLKGDIHYHDLDYHPYMPLTNCSLIDFQGMLSKGFKIGNAEVESPKSIQTATAQMAQIIANVASSQYGGCSANRVDELLAPYAQLNYQKHMQDALVWIEGQEKQEAYAMAKTKKDIYDAMQSLEYEINTLYTSQGQTPFTTLGFGLGTSEFERCIQEAILKVRIQGIGKEGRTAIFPKLVFTIRQGVNRQAQDPNYDIKQLALECATKRMYPDILNYDKIVELTGSFKVPMGCRSFLQGWKDAEGQDQVEGRMNLGVVTLNLPRIGLEARGSMDRFWDIFKERLAICHDALVFRMHRCFQAQVVNAPILYQYGAFGIRLRPDQEVKQAFDHKRATISLGYIGLYETATAFYGPKWESNPQAKAFTLEIVKALKEATDTWADQEGIHFSVYATPSESLTDRFCRLDQEKFGLVADITDKDYYTNSFHYDVRKSINPFEKIDFEKDYPPYSSGGFIHYCEYPVMKQNPKALEAVWDYSYDKVGYLGTNTPIDTCYQCGFEGDFLPTAKGFRCPACGNQDPQTCDVVKRTCGYLGNPQARPMVHGRHEEIKSRVKHMKNRGERYGGSLA